MKQKINKDEPADAGHRTANRVLDILELLAQSPSGHALRDLSLDLAAPKSSLLPLLRTLTGRGYITQDSRGAYHLGTKVLELSRGANAETDLRTIAHPALAALAAKTGEAMILARLTSDHKAVVYIDKVESIHRIRVAMAVGETRPLHSTSSGRLLLAFMAAPQREAVIKDLVLERYTEKTITRKADLRKEVERIRAAGVCINIDQSVPGQCAIAAPIRDNHGEVVAACVLSAPKERVQKSLPALIEELKAAAGAISQRLGYREKEVA